MKKENVHKPLVFCFSCFTKLFCFQYYKNERKFDHSNKALVQKTYTIIELTTQSQLIT